MAETSGNSTILDELHGSVTVSVDRAAQALGISRAYAYRLVKSGDIPVIRLGVRRVRIPTVELLRMLGGES